MDRENKNAVRAWLEAVIPHIPIRTGMAAANLLPLAQFLHEPFQITPVNFPSRIAEGAALSDTPQTMFQSTKKGEFLFSFNITVLHYFLNEFGFVGPYQNPINPAIQPPWNSMEAGQDAYISYVRENVPKAVPKVRQFIYATKISST